MAKKSTLMPKLKVSMPFIARYTWTRVFLRTFFSKMTNHLFRSLLLLLLTATVPVPGHTQEAVKTVLTTQDGLYQPDVSAFFFDSKGALWAQYVASDRLSRFDGNQWMHFSLSGMGITNYITFLGETKDVLWWDRNEVNSKQILYDKAGNWHVFYMRGKPMLNSHVNGNIQVIDSTFQIWEYNPDLKKFDPKTRLSIQVYTPGMTMQWAKWLTVLQYSNHPHIIKQYVVYNTKPNQQIWQSGQITEEIDFFEKYQLWYNITGFFVVANGKKQRLKFTLPDKPNLAFVSYLELRTNTGIQPGFIVKDAQKQFYVFGLDQYGTPILLLDKIEKNYGNCFVKDREGNWWYNTTGDALICVRKGILSFPESQSAMVKGLHTFAEDEKGHIWMGGYSEQGGFAVWNQRDVVRLTGSVPPNQSILPGAYSDPDGGIFYFSDRAGAALNYVKNGKHQFLNAPNFKTTGYLIKRLRNNKLAAGTASKGLVIFNHPKTGTVQFEVIDNTKGLKLTRVTTFADDRNGRIWMGNTAEGIAIYDPVRDTIINWLRDKSAINRFGIMSTLVDDKDQLWLGSNKGLYILPNASTFDYLKQSIFNYARRINLPLSDTSLITFMGDYEPYLIVGSEKAVHLIDKSSPDEVRPRIFSLWYGKDIDGAGSEQNTIYRDRRGFIWIGTQKGAFRLDLNTLKFDTTQLTISSQHIFVERDTISDFSGIFNLPAGKRENIGIHWGLNEVQLTRHDIFFNVFVIQSNGDTLYQVINTTERYFNCPVLPPGQYKFVIEAFRHNQILDQKKYEVVVPKIWSEYPLFWIGLTTLLALIVSGLIRRFRRQSRLLKEAKLLQDQLEVQVRAAQVSQDQLRVQTLSNFLNPHFINNSLGHIQGKLSDPESKIMTGRLADIVRTIYDSTRHNRITHSLAQEMQCVEDFLLITKARYGHQIAYNIPDMHFFEESTYVEVPIFLLQIYVENAIEKGLRPDKTAGTVTIDARYTNDGVHICISDDGTGRIGDPYEERSVKSSTKMMEELKDLLNKHNPTPLTIEYEDFWLPPDTKNTEPHGTKVHFFIPIQYRYEI
jgi:hypothetical protein